MNKQTIFIILVIGYFNFCLALSIIAPFFPQFAESKGISQSIVGIIFSANPVGAVIAALTLGKILNEKNRFKMMIVGLFFLSLGLFLFMITNYLSKINIIIIGVLARFMNGVGQSSFVTSFLAYIPLLFPDKIGSYMSVAELVGSLGFMIGPLVGSLLYRIGGFITPFLVFGSLSALIAVLLFFGVNVQVSKVEEKEKLIDNTQEVKIQDIDEHKDSHEKGSPEKGSLHKASHKSQTLILRLPNSSSILAGSQLQVTSSPKDDLGYINVLSHYPIFMSTFMGFLVNFKFTFYTLLSALFFETVYHATPENIGYYLIIEPITFGLTALATGQIKRYQTKVYKQNYVEKSLFTWAYQLWAYRFYLLDLIKHLQDQSLIYITLYLVFYYLDSELPLCQNYILTNLNSYVLQIQILNKMLLFYYPENELQCANYASALFNAGLSGGELCGPIIGGILASHFSYQRTFALLGLAILFISLFYIPILRIDFDKYQKKENEKNNEQ